MLDENNQFIQAIIDYQNKGKAQEVIQYVYTPKWRSTETRFVSFGRNRNWDRNCIYFHVQC